MTATHCERCVHLVAEPLKIDLPPTIDVVKPVDCLSLNAQCNHERHSNEKGISCLVDVVVSGSRGGAGRTVSCAVSNVARQWHDRWCSRRGWNAVLLQR